MEFSEVFSSSLFFARPIPRSIRITYRTWLTSFEWCVIFLMTALILHKVLPPNNTCWWDLFSQG